MDCQFYSAPVQFGQHEMASRIFERSDPEHNWWLRDDCVEIRSVGSKTERVVGPCDSCIDCEADAEYGISIVAKTLRRDVETDGTVHQVFCAEQFDDRAQ